MPQHLHFHRNPHPAGFPVVLHPAGPVSKSKFPILDPIALCGHLIQQAVLIEMEHGRYRQARVPQGGPGGVRIDALPLNAAGQPGRREPLWVDKRVSRPKINGLRARRSCLTQRRYGMLKGRDFQCAPGRSSSSLFLARSSVGQSASANSSRGPRRPVTGRQRTSLRLDG